jgi:phage-related protein
MAQLGRAFIEVRADLSKFPGELRTKLEAALREGTSGLSFKETEEVAEKAGVRAGEKLADGVDKGSKSRMRQVAFNAASQFADGFSSFLGRVLFNRASMWTGLILAAGTAISELLPAVYALAATGPALITSLIGLAATLKLAFHGVGDAIGAAFSGDAGKLNEALKNLTPSARSFVQEIAKLRPTLQGLQRDVQQAFFVQFEGSLTRLTTTLLPALHAGLTGLAGSLGQVAKQIMGALSTGQARDALSGFFGGLRAIFAALAPALGGLTRSFLTLLQASTPLVTTLGVGLAHVLDMFNQWIAKAQNSGALTRLFEAGLGALANLAGLLGNVLDLVGALMSGLSAGGGAMIGVLSDVAAVLATVFKSAEGQQLLATISTLFQLLGQLLIQVLVPLLPSIIQLANAFGQQFADALIVLTPYLVQLAQTLIPLLDFVAAHADVFGPIAAGLLAFSGLSNVFNLLVPAIEGATVAMLGFDAAADANPIGLITLAVEALIVGLVLLIANWKTVKQWGEEAWKGILIAGKATWDWLKGIGSSIGDFFGGIGDWFAALPGRIGDWLAALPGALAQAFTDAVNFAAEALGFAIGLLIGEFFALPGQIWNALQSLGNTLVGVFTAAWTWLSSTVSTAIDNLLIFFVSLPGRIWNAITSIPGLIGRAFEDAWNWAKRAVQQGADAVVDFARKLPGRLMGFFDNVGHVILGGLKSGINGVIDSFNHGIDEASHFTHISLPHIPRLGTGGIVDQPTLALLAEKGHPEVVLPTDDMARAQQLLDQSGLSARMAQGAVGTTNVYVTAILGTGEILRVLDQRVELHLDRQSDRMSSGVRSM